MGSEKYLTIFIAELSTMFRISHRTARKYIRDQRWDQIPPPSMRQAGRLVWFPAQVEEWMCSKDRTANDSSCHVIQPEKMLHERPIVSRSRKGKGNKTKAQRISERREADVLISQDLSQEK